MSSLAEIISENLDSGKLTCTTAYKISAKAKIPIGEVGKVAQKSNIRISECGLGQFGKLEKGEYSKDAHQKMIPFVDERNKIKCEVARGLAGGVGLKNMRKTLEVANIDVIYCGLGCFKEKRRTRLYLKTKTWMENEKKDLLFGKGKTEILIEIERTGSILKAAKNLDMNYKKAWSHIKLLQKNLNDVLVETKQGGGIDAGTKLTPIANEYITKYKQLQKEVEDFANERFKELFLKPRNKREFK
ncbi:MAG: LysR family transcriptional regulator [Epsilonproteobacteria bacterium]|nr:LysR family transcriptional regulator [Campylobacterota bacterium]